MRIEVRETESEVARAVGERALALARGLRECHVVLATGHTMCEPYAWLAKNAGPENFRNAWFFNLDEYRGMGLRLDLPPARDQSFARFLHERFLAPLSIPPKRVCLVDGTAPDVDAHAREYRSALFGPGRPVLAFLGIGRDGHLAFNMPATPFSRGMHVARLSPETIEDNYRAFFAPADIPRENMPREALTLGIDDIMRCTCLLVVATGASKAKVVYDIFSSPISEDLPATVLRNHPDATLFLDAEAARLLPSGLRGN